MLDVRTLTKSKIWSLSNGAIAQLGERLICIQEVRGSIPRSSTNFAYTVLESRSFISNKRRNFPPSLSQVGALKE